MTATIEKLHPSFWNIRGAFKVAGLLDVGTQMSLAKRPSGGFVLLDSLALSGDLKEQIMGQTDGGQAVEAVLNLHPFHTVHVEAVAEMFPAAKLYGTRRHRRLFPHLRWEETHTEDPELSDLFGEDFVFSVPRGVDFIPHNENLHFASVLAYHEESQVLHVDDTLTFSRLPLVGGLSLHPSLGSVLERRPGAARDFRAWAGELTELCRQTKRICTAHMRGLPDEDVQQNLADHVQSAFSAVEKKLARHERRFD